MRAQDKPSCAPKALSENHSKTSMSAVPPEKRDMFISKALSYLLRHGADKEKLPLDEHGWAKVSDVLANNRIRTHRATQEDIRRIVAQNAKQRFTLRERSDGDYICANQGHSLERVCPELELLTSETMPREVYHGTYENKLDTIMQHGLNRMARNHIHLACNEPWSRSGSRASSTVFIYIDIDKCLSAGISFYRSKNGVILTSGNAQGCIPSEYFARVERRSKS
ncbi:hypothetical protein CLUG_04058 [Clavispora lusitaniae ATCC 42720]|uniref:2'-phosphotransferase n=1 Tax=Clavispora lusitaniae (strain ATCC 42720) TaxID=306902 RepID=C4Y4S0_CLAL4|nr:uncharacterized protein CLUG_04058 [Clavispora lusitaniae ATCC 42720]EEQ39930.1 hypothetical protein CLUG_04058 [Clavispora lusitaniae ATCC 42720]